MSLLDEMTMGSLAVGCHPTILTLTPDESRVLIGMYKDSPRGPFSIVIVVNPKEKKIWSSQQSLLPKALAIVFQSSHKMLAISSSSIGGINLIELEKAFPNRRIFSLSGGVTEKVNIDSLAELMALSSDNKIVFVNIEDSLEGKFSLQAWNVSNISSPILLNSFKTDKSPISVKISEDNQKLFIMDSVKTYIYDVSSLTSASLIGSYPIYSVEEKKLECTTRELVILQNGDYQYVLQTTKEHASDPIDMRSLKIINSANESSPVKINLKDDPLRWMPGQILLSRMKRLYFGEMKLIFISTMCQFQALQF